MGKKTVEFKMIWCVIVFMWVVSLFSSSALRVLVSFLAHRLYIETCTPTIALWKYTLAACFHNSSNKSNCPMTTMVRTSPLLSVRKFHILITLHLK